MTQICLQSPSVGALVRQCKAAGMTQHVGMRFERQLSLNASTLDQLGKASGGEWRTSLTDKHKR